MTATVTSPAAVSAISEVARRSTPRRRRRRGGLWIGALLPVAVIGLWQLLSAARVIDNQLFPAPSDVAVNFWALTVNGILLENFLVSLARATGGLVIGATLGLIAGVLVGFSTIAEKVVDPTLQMLRTVPLLAVTPLFILWFGFGELSKVILITTGAFFPMYVNTFLGVRGVDRKLFEVGQVMQYSTWDQVRLLIVPGALPNILLGLRLSVGMAWLCLVVAELTGAQSGIGYLIQDARSLLNTATVMVGVVVFAAVGKISDSLVRILERRLLGWRDNYDGA
ncbi:alkanesulfonate transporter subunit; membrane component of ABC superfamily [Microbacterium sp. C448]|uniref:ABC transporter permease n=1 Tax=Microbacterium sp. C448 TaxID=1177594 RepID=UPI0003DE2651|nr:ABC transporter permease [Microbacterium sp. C448]CDK01790.1 alkanesulfonate transporter subunit; membrane component of ABC superfamily [Microbacterium sp. C448]